MKKQKPLKCKEISLITFIDEFGNFLAKSPKEPYGLGFFSCNEKDMNVLNKRLKERIPKKIHLREEETKETLYKTVKKVASFLKNCNKKINGGGLVFPDPDIRKKLRNYFASFPENKIFNVSKNYKDNLEVIQMHECLKALIPAFAFMYENYSQINLKVCFESSGGIEDFYNRNKKAIEKQLGTNLMVDWYIRDLKNVWPNMPNFGPISIYVTNQKENPKLLEVADVFAYITRKVWSHRNKEDDFTNELYQLLISHFNIFDSMPNSEEMLFKKGIFQVRYHGM